MKSGDIFKSWPAVVSAAILVTGLTVSWQHDFRSVRSRPPPPVSVAPAQRDFVPIAPSTPGRWTRPKPVDGRGFELFTAPALVVNQQTGRLEVLGEQAAPARVALGRPPFRVLGIHRTPLPIALKGVTRIDDVPRAIFFVGRSNHPTIVGAGATIGLTSWRLKQLKLGARGESPIATLTEDGTEKSVAMGVGQPLLAGESIAWIASGDDEGQLRRVGDSIAWDGSTWRIAAISEGPDEAVTFACGEKEWVFVAENEIAGGTVPANSPAPAILAVGGAAIRPEEQP